MGSSWLLNLSALGLPTSGSGELLLLHCSRLAGGSGDILALAAALYNAGLSFVRSNKRKAGVNRQLILFAHLSNFTDNA